MNKTEIRNLVIIWIVALGLAGACGFFYYRLNLSPELLNPVAESGTTSWVTAPATVLAEKVRVNAAWTMATIFPFLFAPLLMVLYVIVRFSKRRNPVAAKFHENVPLEVFWSLAPAMFLVAMALPAFSILAYMEKEPEEIDVVVDVTGYQFYWQYNFPKYDVTVTDDGTGSTPVYFPVDQNVMLYGQSPQVNHAWWVPAFGLKFDVIPGRITRGWIRPTQEGSFKGQCAELCGALHAYMLIHVNVVSEKEFYQWLYDQDATFPPEEVARVEQLLGVDLDEPPVSEEGEEPAPAA